MSEELEAILRAQYDGGYDTDREARQLQSAIERLAKDPLESQRVRNIVDAVDIQMNAGSAGTHPAGLAPVHDWRTARARRQRRFSRGLWIAAAAVVALIATAASMAALLASSAGRAGVTAVGYSSTQGPVVFNGGSAVRFEPTTTVFADPAAAVMALTPIARWLAADRTRHAWLEGTTADVGPITGQIELSKLRADRVRAELIALGASPAQISTKGVGSRFPQFVPDRDPSGVLLPGPAALNGSVRITLS